MAGLDSTSPIGIFDSGVGGLTVLNEIHKLLPFESTIYLGDTARVPYGTRTSDTVERYSIESTAFLLKKGIKLLVVACNTVSAISLPVLSEDLPVPVIGVIEPGSRAAVGSKKVGVAGTEATIKSGAYKRQIQAFDSNIEVFEKACPLFVPLVEEGWFKGPIVEAIVETYLGAMTRLEIDTLVLGCTHYPLLKEVIQKVLGHSVLLVDSAVETASAVKNALISLGIFNEDKTVTARQEYYVTDGPERFLAIAKILLKYDFLDINLIDINCLIESMKD